MERAEQPEHSSTPRRGIARRLWRVLRPLLIAYLGVVILLSVFERSLIFFPMKHPAGAWELQPPAAEDVFFTAGDGTRLHGWYAAQDDPSAVILFAHGNAGNITHRADVLERLHRDLHCTVLVFDYRGYGKSEGSPSEAGVLADGRAARDWLAERAGTAPEDLVLMGRSLGTAVAVDLAAAGGACGLVLYSAFPSMPEVAARHYPWLPVRWLMRTRFDSVSKIRRYHGPLLQVHGDDDEIITADLGRQLFEAAPTQDKRWLTVPGGHNDPPPEIFYSRLRGFLSSLHPPRE